MKKHHLLFGILLSCLLTTGCEISSSRQLEEEIAKLDAEIKGLHAKRSELLQLHDEIADLKKRIDETQRKKDQFLQDHPGLEEYAKKEWAKESK
ncbi:MAG TPA: hypothetical protein PKO06_00445 [Candidatus Ozemobacteraceae bacterium]|nr:hypothetical protein [Candidatus Ozemobacteraceae bacterium]